MDIGSAIRQIDQQRKEQDAIYHSAAVRHGLSDTAFWVLYVVSEAGSSYTQQELARQCFFPKQTVNTAVSNLAREGYLTLELIPGSRNLKRISLTEKGLAFAREVAIPAREAEARAYGKLSEGELQLYLALTERLTANLREEMETI